MQFAPAAHAAVPDWVKPALRYLDNNGHFDRDRFRPNKPMSRKRFTRLMRSVFEGGYSGTEGDVTAAEVARALVVAVGERDVAVNLSRSTSPDGWDPGMSRRGAFEVVARELGLRHDRVGDEESFEAWSGEALRQADILYAVWKAKVDPDTWASESLMGFSLADYDPARRAVVKYAFSLLGSPYVWAGEWPTRTPEGYPYGTQSAGGFDCSGFVWYVMKKASTNYKPIDRPYAGWRLDERSSADMARATTNRLTFKQLKPGDLVFFSADGAEAKAGSVYHVAVYLGNGWVVHSSGSRAGASLAFIGKGSWWRSQVAWGRRVIPATA